MSEKIYTCIDCGKELEQSHPFTYCDACWEGHYPTPTSSAGIDEQLDAMWEEFGLESWTMKAEANTYILDLFERELIGSNEMKAAIQKGDYIGTSSPEAIRDSFRAEMRAKLRAIDEK